MKNKGDIKAIIHDWDDTITNSFEAYSSWYGHFAELHGYDVPDKEQVKMHWGNPVSKIMIGLWPTMDEREAEKLLSKFNKSDSFIKADYSPQPFLGVKDTLEQLHAAGYILGILSSGQLSSIERGYKKYIHPDMPYHDLVFTQFDSEYHKPDPRVFDGILSELSDRGINDNETIYVGDHMFDYLASRDRGLDFIAVTTGVTKKRDFVDAGLDEKLILDSFADIPEFLDD